MSRHSAVFGGTKARTQEGTDSGKAVSIKTDTVLGQRLHSLLCNNRECGSDFKRAGRSLTPQPHQTWGTAHSCYAFGPAIPRRLRGEANSRRVPPLLGQGNERTKKNLASRHNKRVSVSLEAKGQRTRENKSVTLRATTRLKLKNDRGFTHPCPATQLCLGALKPGHRKERTRERLYH